MSIRVFLSYSSRDKEAIQRLSTDLRSAGVNIWLDEWEILVGDRIAQKIQEGLSDSDYLAVWLTRDAISSGWVTREWQAKYHEEASANSVAVLPLLAEDLEIPTLLSGKKYADFRHDYGIGLKELLRVFESRHDLSAAESAGERRNFTGTYNEVSMAAVNDLHKARTSFNTSPSGSLSKALLDGISDLHATPHIKKSVFQVLSHPDYPRWMSISGRLTRNPIWNSISDDRKDAFRITHELNGPSPPSLMHLDMLLIRRNNALGRGELYTYYSRDWETHLLRFRQWLPEDDPNRRSEINAKKMAKH